MPTYQYQCTECGHELETFQSMREEPLKECPECDLPGLQRLISGGAGIIFKGSGFYETDYKRSGGKQEGEANNGGASPNGESDKGKTAQPPAGQTASETKSPSAVKTPTAGKDH